jgi:hypothetical protein
VDQLDSILGHEFLELNTSERGPVVCHDLLWKFVSGENVPQLLDGLGT